MRVTRSRPRWSSSTDTSSAMVWKWPRGLKLEWPCAQGWRQPQCSSTVCSSGRVWKFAGSSGHLQGAAAHLQGSLPPLSTHPSAQRPPTAPGRSMATMRMRCIGGGVQQAVSPMAGWSIGRQQCGRVGSLSPAQQMANARPVPATNPRWFLHPFSPGSHSLPPAAYLPLRRGVQQRRLQPGRGPAVEVQEGLDRPGGRVERVPCAGQQEGSLVNSCPPLALCASP